MSRPSIALAMIVKNEAENLPRIFESIRGCFDEIHITDTGSTDNTVEISKSLGAQVHYFEWVNDFSAARNFSFSHPKTDYIAWFDGDDVLENRDAFIQFRDHVMVLGDYWIAPYHYSSDAQGQSVCTFSRERVVRRDRGFSWSYPVHEGIRPDSGKGPIRVQITPAWAIRHMRTDADLQKDRSRNLSIFEEIKKNRKMDAREKYYYGKELFESGKTIEAINQFLLANAETDLELHDRVLSFQYLCYAYMQCNQFAQAIDSAHSGLMLQPQRAEFHTIIGDCYLKMGRLIDAKPFFSAAKGCQEQLGQGGATAIFHHKDAYTSYPRNQLARIHANLGQFDEAVKEAEDCVSRYRSEEGQAILTEVNKIVSSFSSFKNASPCDDIVITTTPTTAYEFDPNTYKTQATGGSETALIEMAYWIKKLSGRPVKVFNMRQNMGTFDGVEYVPNTQVHEYFSKNKPFLNISWRHTIKLTDAPTFIWSHDLTTQGVEQTENYDKVLCLTPFHKHYMMSTQGVPEHKIHVTRNGIRPDRFLGGPWKKDPWKFVFSSSPDRGLDRAMIVLDKVREKYPEIKLHVFYGIEHLPKWGLQGLHDQLKKMMSDRKSYVIYHGAIQQDELMRHFKESAYCVQPSDFIETSKITALEMACSGIYQVTRAVGGCVDTLRPIAAAGMASLVNSDCITPEEFQVYIDATIHAIEREAYKSVNVHASQYSWEGVAKDWIRELPELAYGQSMKVANG